MSDDADEDRTRVDLGTLARDPAELENLSSTELLRELTGQVGLLAKKQIELAAAELHADLQAELAMVKGFGIAAVAALMTLTMLLVAGASALALVTAGWLAALIVAGGMLVVTLVAAAIGRSHRVRSLLRRTRQTLKEDVQWTKGNVA